MATYFAVRGRAGPGHIMRHLLHRHQHTKCRANNSQLSPIPWLERAALLKPRATAIKYGDDVAMSYSELMVRSTTRWMAVMWFPWELPLSHQPAWIPPISDRQICSVYLSTPRVLLQDFRTVKSCRVGAVELWSLKAVIALSEGNLRTAVLIDRMGNQRGTVPHGV